MSTTATAPLTRRDRLTESPMTKLDWVISCLAGLGLIACAVVAVAFAVMVATAEPSPFCPPDGCFVPGAPFLLVAVGLAGPLLAAALITLRVRARDYSGLPVYLVLIWMLQVVFTVITVYGVYID